MEIRITYDDGRTFVTQIPNGNITSVTMCLLNQHYVKIGNFDRPLCDEMKGLAGNENKGDHFN